MHLDRYERAILGLLEDCEHGMYRADIHNHIAIDDPVGDALDNLCKQGFITNDAGLFSREGEPSQCPRCGHGVQPIKDGVGGYCWRCGWSTDTPVDDLVREATTPDRETVDRIVDKALQDPDDPHGTQRR